MHQLDTDVRRAPIAVAVFAAILLIWPAIACAHVFPAAEAPKAGETLNSAPREVTITFDGPIESLFATVNVTDDKGRDETAGPVTVGADHRAASAPLKPLSPGDYDVKWGVVAEDGHRTEGSYEFTVAGAK
jgi:methionine-rich copper-binding protein CopC